MSQISRNVDRYANKVSPKQRNLTFETPHLSRITFEGSAIRMQNTNGTDNKRNEETEQQTKVTDFVESPDEKTKFTIEGTNQTLISADSSSQSQDEADQIETAKEKRKWGLPANGLQAFKLLKLMLPNRTKSFSEECEHLKPVPLRPLVQRTGHQRAKFTVESYFREKALSVPTADSTLKPDQTVYSLHEQTKSLSSRRMNGLKRRKIASSIDQRGVVHPQSQQFNQEQILSPKGKSLPRIAPPQTSSNGYKLTPKQSLDATKMTIVSSQESHRNQGSLKNMMGGSIQSYLSGLGQRNFIRNQVEASFDNLKLTQKPAYPRNEEVNAEAFVKTPKFQVSHVKIMTPQVSSRNLPKFSSPSRLPSHERSLFYTEYNSPKRIEAMLPPAVFSKERKFFVPKRKTEVNDSRSSSLKSLSEETTNFQPIESIPVSIFNEEVKTMPMTKKFFSHRSSTMNNQSVANRLLVRRMTTKFMSKGVRQSKLTTAKISQSTFGTQKKDGPPILESNRVFELIKCYQERQSMKLDPIMASFIEQSPDQDSEEPVFIDFKTLSTILLKDLEARQIRHDIELTRLKRQQLQERLLQQEDGNEMKLKYRVLFEEFLLSLINSKRDITPDVQLDEVYQNLTEKQRAFHELVITKANPVLPAKLEVLLPEPHQALLRRPEGQLIATNASFELLKQLVESYQAEELKMKNKMLSKLRSAFQSKISQAIGKARFNENVDPRMKAVDARVLYWDSDDSCDSSLHTDSTFSEQAPNEPEPLAVLGEISEQSDSDSQSEEKSSEEEIQIQAKVKQVRLIDIESHPEVKTEKVLFKQGVKSDFFAETRKLSSNGNLGRSPPPYSKAQTAFICKQAERNVTPRPTLVNVNDRQVSLHKVWLNDAEAEGLQAYFQRTPLDIRSIHLSGNGLKDDSLSWILNGLREKKLERITIQQNEIGLKTMAHLASFFNLNLKALELNDIRFTDRLLERIGFDFMPLSHVRTLTLTNIQLSHPATLTKLKQYLEADNVFLRELNLSRVFLNGQQLLEILTLINDCKRTLTSLNLSFNCNQKQQDKAFKSQIIKLLTSYLKTNSFLCHLNLAGMELGDSLLDLIPSIKDSSVLNAVHLSDNEISMPAKQAIFNMLNCDFKGAKQKRDHHSIKVGGLSQIEDQSSLQTRLVNHQMLVETRDEINQRANVKTADPLVLFRFLGHPEFSRGVHQTESLLNDPGENWQISLREECWICDRWNYVIVFFHRHRCHQQMDQITKGSDDYTVINEHIFTKTPIDTTSGQVNATKAPLLSGSLNGWALHEMSKLTDLMQQIALMRDFKQEVSKIEGVTTTQRFGQNFVQRRLYQRSKNVTRKEMEFSMKSLFVEDLRRLLPQAHDAVLVNWPDEQDLSEIKPDSYFVWTGYVKPGQHSCIIARREKQKHEEQEEIITDSSFESQYETENEEESTLLPLQIFKRKVVVTVRKDDVEIVNANEIDATTGHNTRQHTPMKLQSEVAKKGLAEKLSEHLVSRLAQFEESSRNQTVQEERFSIFENQAKDDQSLITNAFNCDHKFWRLDELLQGCNSNQNQKVQELMHEFFPVIQEVFLERAARGQVYPELDLWSMQELVEEWQLPDFDNQTIQSIINMVTDSGNNHPVQVSTNEDVSYFENLSINANSPTSKSPRALNKRLSLIPTKSKPIQIVIKKGGFSLMPKKEIRRQTESFALPSQVEKIMSVKEEKEAVSVFMHHKLDLAMTQTIATNKYRLLRFQFLDVILVLAIAIAFDNFKTKKTARFQRAETMIPNSPHNERVNKSDLNVAEALSDLLHNHITTKTQFKMQVNSWRVQHLWTSNVNKLLGANLDYVAVLFNSLLEPHRGKRQFTVKSAQNFAKTLQKQQCGDDQLAQSEKPVLPDGYPKGGYLYSVVIQDVEYCFGLSKSTVVDNCSANYKYSYLKFLEFLEFLTRLACRSQLIMLPKNPTKQQVASQPQMLSHLQVVRRTMFPGQQPMHESAEALKSLFMFIYAAYPLK